MYGFLNTSVKRKAFKKALNNAFNSGYNPNAVASDKARPAHLGKTVEPVELSVQTVPYAKKVAKSIRKPESNLIDLSKHKNWRENETQKSAPKEISRGASLFDELFPEERKDSSMAPVKIKSSTNTVLDSMFPEDKEPDLSNEFVFADDLDYGDNTAQVEESPSDEEITRMGESSWEELFESLKFDDDDDSDPDVVVEKPVKFEIIKDEAPVIDDKVKETEKPVTAQKKTTAKTSATTAAKKTTATKSAAKAATATTAKTAAKTDSSIATKTKAAAKNKKRKNKIKFDADIIGGW